MKAESHPRGAADLVEEYLFGGVYFDPNREIDESGYET
jgi:hypothetical protein